MLIDRVFDMLSCIGSVSAINHLDQVLGVGKVLKGAVVRVV